MLGVMCDNPQCMEAMTGLEETCSMRAMDTTMGPGAAMRAQCNSEGRGECMDGLALLTGRECMPVFEMIAEMEGQNASEAQSSFGRMTEMMTMMCSECYLQAISMRAACQNPCDACVAGTECNGILMHLRDECGSDMVPGSGQPGGYLDMAGDVSRHCSMSHCNPHTVNTNQCHAKRVTLSRNDAMMAGANICDEPRS